MYYLLTRQCVNLCLCLRREGIKNDNLDEVEARYVHPKLREAMLKETAPVRRAAAGVSDDGTD